MVVFVSRVPLSRCLSVALHTGRSRLAMNRLMARALTTARVGPDRVLPANSLTTTWPDGAVEVRSNHPDPSNQWTPLSVWTMLQNTVDRVPDHEALAVKRNGVWIKWTYKEYQEDVRTVAKAFIKLGLKPHYSVNILGFNAPEWHISNVAAVVAGGLGVGIYTTNSSDAVRYVAQHSRANIMVVDDQEQLDKVEMNRDQLKDLQHVIQWGDWQPNSLSPKGTFSVTSPDVINWQQLLDIGRAEPDSILQERLEKQAVNQPAVLIYTSGTTGNPKGVILSQDNITWCSRTAHEFNGWIYDKEVHVSYLPLSHIAAQIIDIFLVIQGGGAIYFADKMALQGTLLQTLVEVRPTRFFGVPRVWEKIHEKMLEIGKQNTGLKKSIATWAKNASFAHHQDLMSGGKGGGLGYSIAKKVVLSKVAMALGFDRCLGRYSSAAPLNPHTFQYFQSLDLPIQELFGSSETCGPQTKSDYPLGTKCGSVGKSYPNFETEIMNPDSKGIGEIVTRGRHVCLGYVWDEKKTAELIDSEGWVHSGDLGSKDQDGFLFVRGRMKEILVTGGGENVAPVPIEDLIKETMSSIVSQAMVVGDQRKHLAVVLTLRTVLDGNNQPTDVLHPDVQKWLEEMGCDAKSPAEVISSDNEDVNIAIMNHLKKVNSKAISNAQKVHKFMIAPKDFTLAGGEMTPTMKLKRHVVLEMYGAEIERMYEYQAQSSMW